MQLYLEKIQDTQLGGPTRLAPVMQWAEHYTRTNQPNANQQYVVVVIITDGVINDVDETVEQIINVSKTPLSFVIIGVGPADFTLMEEMFNWSRRPLRSKKAGNLQRHNTYFAAFRRHDNGYGLDSSMAQEAFAHVSRQVVNFMKLNGIEPDPPRNKSVQAWDYIPGDSIGSGAVPRQRPSSPRIHKRSTEPIPRCPTCGSLIEANNNVAT